MKTGPLSQILTGLGDHHWTVVPRMKNSRGFSLIDTTFTELATAPDLWRMTLNLPEWLKTTLKKWIGLAASNTILLNSDSMARERI